HVFVAASNSGTVRMSSPDAPAVHSKLVPHEVARRPSPPRAIVPRRDCRSRCQLPSTQNSIVDNLSLSSLTPSFASVPWGGHLRRAVRPPPTDALPRRAPCPPASPSPPPTPPSPNPPPPPPTPPPPPPTAPPAPTRRPTPPARARPQPPARPRRDVIEEAFAEAVLALRADIRGDDPKLKQAAANMLLRLWMTLVRHRGRAPAGKPAAE